MAEKKKQPWSTQVMDANNAYADTIEQNANNLAAATQAAGQAQMDELAAAQAAQQQANQTAMDTYRQRMEEGYTSFADIIGARERQMQQEQEEAQQRVAADNRAARWTGLTEMASSIANLVGVGAGNAVSQQYKSYSQDWMKKADQDVREHRMRMDNLRARQDALKQQLAQLRMGDAGTALQNAQRMADQAYQNSLQLGQMRYNNAVNPATLRAQGLEKGAAARVQGVQSAASVGMNEASLAQRQAEHAASMRAKGLNPDGSPNDNYMTEVAKATKKSSGGSGSGNPYDIVVDGKHYNVNMTKETYESAIRRGREEIQKDIMAMAGFNGDWSEFEKLSGGRMTNKERRDARRDGTYGKYGDYADIVSAVSGTGDIDADNEFIKDYIEKNKSKMPNTNIYLIGVAGNAAENGLVNDAEYGDAEDTSISADLNRTPAGSTATAKAGAPARSIEDDLWGNGSEATGGQSAVEEKKEEEAPASAPQEPATENPKVGNPHWQYWHERWNAQPIDNQRFKGAYKDALKSLLSKAAGDYSKATGDNMSSYYEKPSNLDLAVAQLRRHQSQEGLDNWDDAIDSIVNGSEISKYISSEDRERLRQMMNDKDNLSAYEFAKKYNISL